MAAQMRVLRRRIRSVQSTKKITKASELIATSRIARAQSRVEASRPYAQEITKVLSALASAAGTLDNPLLVERENPTRAAMLVVTSDRGLCGGYNANLLRAAEELHALLRDEGKSVTLYLIGRKAVSYYKFRQRPIEQSWTGFSEQPAYDDAAEAGNVLVRAFLAGADDSDGPGDSPGGDAGPDGVPGVDELHIVYTEFRSMVTQTPRARRTAPLPRPRGTPQGASSGRVRTARPRCMSSSPTPTSYSGTCCRNTSIPGFTRRCWRRRHRSRPPVARR